MRALIPVAGVGTRLRPHTYSLPKVLLNVGGKPIVGHIVDKLYDIGIKEISVVVGYMGEMVEEYLKKISKRTSNFSIRKRDWDSDMPRTLHFLKTTAMSRF